MTAHPQNAPQPKFGFEATEIIYLVGVVFLFIGLWLAIGLGVAFASVGGVLIATAILNSVMRYRQEIHNVV
jgi:UPF0716 family protein affecting phage T7 exclusion